MMSSTTEPWPEAPTTMMDTRSGTLAAYSHRGVVGEMRHCLALQGTGEPRDRAVGSPAPSLLIFAPLEEQLLWASTFDTVEELRPVAARPR